MPYGRSETRGSCHTRLSGSWKPAELCGSWKEIDWSCTPAVASILLFRGGATGPPAGEAADGTAMEHTVRANDIENHDGSVLDGPAMETDSSGLSDVKEPLLRKRTRNTTSQIAVVGANVCPIESLDYEIVENDLYKQDWRSRKKVQIYQYVVLKWTLALLIGLSTGLVGFFNNMAVENIAGFKLLLTGNLMLQHRYYLAFAAFAGCNLILATFAAAICAYIAPAAAGSGIPEVKAYLNGVDAHSILAPSTLFVKVEKCSFMEDIFHNCCGCCGTEDFDRILPEWEMWTFWKRWSNNVRYQFNCHHI